MDIDKVRRTIRTYQNELSAAEIGLSQIVHGLGKLDEAILFAFNEKDPDPERLRALLNECQRAVRLGTDTILDRVKGGVGEAEVKTFLSRRSALGRELMLAAEEP